MSEGKTSPSKRLFLALWPDEEVRRQLFECQQQLLTSKSLFPARPVEPQNLHITLHFLGAVPQDSIPGLITSLGTVCSPSFELEIDHWGYFPRPKILWLGAKDEPTALAQLLARSQKCINQCLRDYKQKKFMTHITVFRNMLTTIELDKIQSLKWQIENFVLVESIMRKKGVEYRVLEEWRLGGNRL